MRRVVESMGYAVTTCNGATQALQRVSERSFDAILCDIFMPDSDGVSLLKRLRREGDETPFILMSGVADPLKPVEGINQGACCFITKPVTADVLESTLGRVVAVE